MADTAIIQWNLYNWITIVLMAALGMALVGFGASMLRQYMPSAGGMQGS
jgi:hypothetical protein